MNLHRKPKHGHYAATLADLGLANLTAEGMAGPVVLQTLNQWFQATAELQPDTTGPRRWHIRTDARIWGE